MKTLAEGLFDKDLVEKSPFDDPDFKKWINQPDILWYLVYYWESGEDFVFTDFYEQEWSEYKILVDSVLNLLNSDMNRVFGKKYCWWRISYYDYDNVEDQFETEGDFESALADVMADVKRKSVKERDGVWKTWFKGGIPKNSEVKYFFDYFDDLPFTKPGKLDGAIMLTNGDNFVFLGFPKNTNKLVLNLFNIK